MFNRYIFLFLFIFKIILPASYPNDATDRLVNIFTTIQTLNAGDYVSSTGATQGLCWFKAGIKIAGASGLVNVATPIFVDREIYLDGQVSLNLQKDLILSGSVRICADSTSGYISFGTGVFVGSKLILTGPVDLETTVRCTFGAFEIQGNGNSINMRQNTFYPSNATSFKLNNCLLYNIPELGLSNVAYPIFTDLDNVVLKLSNDLDAHSRSLTINGDVSILGPYIFTMYYSCSINDASFLHFEPESTLFLNPTFKNLTFKGNKTGGFHFNGCTIDISNADLTINEGNVIFENEVRIYDGSNNKKFVIGPNCTAHILGGARVILDGTTTFSIL
ncbi:MAG: hypothetical protein SZ59_C0004G0094 [candidate division TM6 bacterium GW2011_GWF2_28_16]|nr:MAG: hypothetical protein SZ59_C0004G0094 [candidate division TM6 bacterium GW2011_GWF2_28_16]